MSVVTYRYLQNKMDMYDRNMYKNNVKQRT